MSPAPEESSSPAQPVRAPRIAHVLFMDVVAYSQLPTDHQIEVRDRLREIVRAIPEFRQEVRDGELISRDTGDGMALAFFANLTAPVACARQIAQVLESRPQFKLRIGIHTGPVYVDTDISGTQNLAGDGINIAQRVMDCGDGGHILVSEQTARNLAQFSALQPALHDLGEIEVKHGVRVHVFNVFVAGEFGNPELPSKVRLARQRNETRAHQEQTELAVHQEMVIRAILDGEVIPFLGAGSSLCDRPSGAAWEPKQSQYLPSGAELAEYLAREFEYPAKYTKLRCPACSEDVNIREKPNDLLRVAQYVMLVLGSGPL